MVTMDNKTIKSLITFFEKYKVYKYKKGEIIYRPGDMFSHVAFAKSGYVKLYTIDSEGAVTTVNLFKPLFFLTLEYATNDSQSRYYFEAVTTVEVWRAPKEEVISFLKENADVLFIVNHMILKVLEETIFNMGNAVGGNSYKKVSSILSSLAKQFGSKDKNKNITIDFGTTHEDIASMTGLTRETVSLQIKKLKDENIIDQDGKFYIINDMESLEKISSLE